MQPSTQTASGISAHSRHAWFVLGFTGLVVLLNILVVTVAAKDRSWAAMWLGIVGGPVLNGALGLLSLLAIPIFKRRRIQFSVWQHVAISLGMPVAAAVLDGIVIFRMDLHGC